MLIKNHKKFFIILLLVFWIVITSHLAASASGIGIDPAAELEELLGDPSAYVEIVESKAFYTVAEISSKLVAIIGFTWLLRAIFPR